MIKTVPENSLKDYVSIATRNEWVYLLSASKTPSFDSPKWALISNGNSTGSSEIIRIDWNIEISVLPLLKRQDADFANY